MPRTAGRGRFGHERDLAQRVHQLGSVEPFSARPAGGSRRDTASACLRGRDRLDVAPRRLQALASQRVEPIPDEEQTFLRTATCLPIAMRDRDRSRVPIAIRVRPDLTRSIAVRARRVPIVPRPIAAKFFVRR
jgi:hypothetical protein